MDEGRWIRIVGGLALVWSVVSAALVWDLTAQAKTPAPQVLAGQPQVVTRIVATASAPTSRLTVDPNPLSVPTTVAVGDTQVPALDSSDREAVQAFYTRYFGLAPVVAIGWTGNVAACTPGDIAADFRHALLQRINAFRALGGVPGTVTLDPIFNYNAQAAALMISANNRLSHSPAETDWPACWSPEGGRGVSHANIHSVRYGLNAIDGYMTDFGPANLSVGHRRWLLHPSQTRVGIGSIPGAEGQLGANAVYVISGGGPRPTTRDGFVAWPPPGYVPNALVYARWSLSLPDADFSQAAVTVTADGRPLAATVIARDDAFGDSTLVWTLAGYNDPASTWHWPALAADTAYTVTISGILGDNQPTTLTYDVVIFTP